MINNRFFDRIDKIDDIGILSKKVCKEYNLGEYLDTRIVEIGYEDFNAIITTSIGKYFMKVFRNTRDDKEAKEVIERAYVAYKSGVKSPKVFQNVTGDIFTNINYNDSNFRLSVMEYIDGKNFFELDREATPEELLEIADLASSFGKIDYKPNFIYDIWRYQVLYKNMKKSNNMLVKNILNIFNQYMRNLKHLIIHYYQNPLHTEI